MKVLITAFAMVMAFPSLGSAAAAIYQPTLDRLVVFVVGSNGHLFDKYWSGSAWVWEDQGLPLGTTAVTDPSVVYQPTLDRIVVFVAGDNGHLFDKYWDGSIWVWEDQGVPSQPGYVVRPSAVYQPTLDRLVVFVMFIGREIDVYELYEKYWDGRAWVWERQGSVAIGLEPSAVSQPTLDRIDVFVVNGSTLVDRYWDGNAWIWYTLGMPPGCHYDQSSRFVPAGIYQPTLDRLVVFIVCTNHDGYHHLYDKYWDGSAWVWEDHGLLPGATSGVLSPSPVYQSAQDRIVVFLPSNNGHLYEFDKYWDGGSGGVWKDQGIPPGAVSIWGTSAVYQPPVDRLVVFVEGYDRFGAHHLYDKYWDGSSWIWEDQGIPR